VRSLLGSDDRWRWQQTALAALPENSLRRAASLESIGPNWGVAVEVLGARRARLPFRHSPDP